MVSIDLLLLPASYQGSKYLLVCVDHLSRYVVLAPLKDKTAKSVAHALITHLFYPYSAPTVLLSDNGAEFCNALLEEISQQFGVKQCFTVTYHPASNGLVERANRKILEVLRPVVGELLETWEDWLPQVAASINSSVCASTGQSPHYILFGVDKRFPYELLSSTHSPVYNAEDYVKCHLKVFSGIHKLVHNKLQATNTAMCKTQHKRATPVTLQVGDFVMVRVPLRDSKLSPKFLGPRSVIHKLEGNKCVLWDSSTRTSETVHADRLKLTKAVPADSEPLPPPFAVHNIRPVPPPPFFYNLRPRQ